MGPPIHAGTLLVWGLYGGLGVWSLLRGASGRGALRPLWSCSTAILALPVALGLALLVCRATGDEVYWLCNCCSERRFEGGNNHFDEDVFFAHVVTLGSLFWLALTSEAHRQMQVENLAFFGILGVGLGASLITWSSVMGPAPGCY